MQKSKPDCALAAWQLIKSRLTKIGGEVKQGIGRKEHKAYIQDVDAYARDLPKLMRIVSVCQYVRDHLLPNLFIKSLSLYNTQIIAAPLKHL